MKQTERSITRISLILEKQQVEKIDQFRKHVPRSTFIALFFKTHLNPSTAQKALEN